MTCFSTPTWIQSVYKSNYKACLEFCDVSHTCTWGDQNMTQCCCSEAWFLIGDTNPLNKSGASLRLIPPNNLGASVKNENQRLSGIIGVQVQKYFLHLIRTQGFSGDSSYLCVGNFPAHVHKYEGYNP